MRRREFISAIAGATVWPFATRAQQPAMPVIGFIAEVPLVEPLLAAFRRAMAELGYVEGKNFAAEYRLKPECYRKLRPISRRLWFGAGDAETFVVLQTVPIGNQVLAWFPSLSGIWLK